MAVLKSPRNTRKKKFWALKYQNNHSTQSKTFNERRHPRAIHQLQTFLRDSAHWVSLKSSIHRIPTHLESVEPKIRPRHIIRYGTNTFDSSTTHPTIMRRHLRVRTNRERLMLALNADNFHDR